LIVHCHGGPTSAASPTLSWGTQYWTSRGFAVLDVNYGGSTGYDPVLALSPDGKRYVSVPSETPTTLPPPGLPFSLVFRAEPGKEDVVLRIAAAYEAASKRRIPPPAFGLL
jgi:Asp-tRNA(Asn)/Glu-tRNA(Gln) amidotransferase A subunit family amidase